MATDWEKRWQDGQTQWDHGEPSPALVHLLQTESNLIPAQGLGLVPGCGGGYDVDLLATDQRHIIGLDMSATCVAKCKEARAGKKTNSEFVCDDFFKFAYPEQKFDLVYDYTFLCALPPDWRPRWAARMAEIIKPGGTLIGLIFPIVDEDLDKCTSPPFPLNPDIYKTLLSDNFDLVYLKEAKGHESRLGKEMMSVWKRKI